MKRRPAIGAFAGVLIAAAALAPPAGAIGVEAAHAIASYRAMQARFYLPQHELYRGEPYHQRRYAYLWPFSQALAATTALATIPGRTARYRRDMVERLHGLRAYWDPSRSPAGYDSTVLATRHGALYFDDNEWVGLGLLRAAPLFSARRPGLLARTEDLFKLTRSGWDRRSSDPCPGGVFWSTQDPEQWRNTTSTAPGAQLGAELYLLTRRRSDRAWALRMYAWVRRCLRASDGLYYDKIDRNGLRDRTKWIYNQGSVLGAEALLYRATGRVLFLHRAERTARAALRYYRPARIDEQPPFFVAIFADDLLMLDAMRHRPVYRRFLARYGDRAWRRHRDQRSGLFDFHQQREVHLLEQAAMVRLYASLAHP